jgi:hypothetical protein
MGSPSRELFTAVDLSYQKQAPEKPGPLRNGAVRRSSLFVGVARDGLSPLLASADMHRKRGDRSHLLRGVGALRCQIRVFATRAHHSCRVFKLQTVFNGFPQRHHGKVWLGALQQPRPVHLSLPAA